MNEQEDLFTKKQSQLMNIAGWANNLAWVALVIYLLLAGLTIFADHANHQRITQQVTSFSEYWEMAMWNPIYYFLDIGADIISRVLTGFIYYVVLKGIALGLYMVIETDMNYREKKGRGGTYEHKIS